MMTGASLQLGARLSAAKQLFFDAPKVMASVNQGTRNVLSKFGAFVRTRAKSSIRRRKGPSKPGQPPSSHTGLLKQHIYFVYEESQRNVVIGPVLLNQQAHELKPMDTTVPGILEHGGQAVKSVRYQSGHRGQKKVAIAVRPYMGPAFETEKPGLDTLWANSVK